MAMAAPSSFHAIRQLRRAEEHMTPDLSHEVLGVKGSEEPTKAQPTTSPRAALAMAVTANEHMELLLRAEDTTAVRAAPQANR